MRGRKVQESKAFVLSRVAYGEADLIVHLFTDQLGVVAALARGARKNSKKFSGSLEPLHTLKVSLFEKKSSDLFGLVESDIATARLQLLNSLEKMEIASKALFWVRKTMPPQQPDARVFQETQLLLDGLNQIDETDATTRLIYFGLSLLQALGFGIELRACVDCTRNCPPERAAYINPERGGLICRACGGGPILLSPELRQELILASAGSQLHSSWNGHDQSRALQIVERALRAHMGVEFS